EASYLKKITDIYGRVVDFTYAEKTTSEYQEPQTESNEPDAYQERYEKKFIDYIEVFDAQNNRLFTIDFDYNFHGTGNLTKRLLAKITQKNALSESLPPMKFEYNSGAPNEAALKKITLPQGGTIEYTYIEKTIQRSDRQASIQAPINFGKPQVFIAEDYVVVTWLNTGTNELKVYAYLWDGEWIESLVDTINNVTIVNPTTNAQSFGIIVEKDFFAIVNNLDLSQQSKPVHIFRKNPYKRGDWLKHAVTISISGGSGGAHGAWLASGEDFVTVLGKERGQLFRFRWKGDSWTLIEDAAVDNDANDDFYLAGTNNYFIDHNKATNPDDIKFYYLDETGGWNVATLPTQLSFDSFQLSAHWFVHNYHAIVEPPNFQAYIYRWSEDFMTFYRDTDLGIIDDDATPQEPAVFLYDALISASGENGSGQNNAKGLRWTGSLWKTKSDFIIDFTSSALGNDFIIRRNRKTNGWVQRWILNPNNPSAGWTLDNEVTGVNYVGFSSFADMYAWFEIGGQAKVYKKLPASWNESSISVWDANDQNLQLGTDFYVYEDHVNGQRNGPAIRFIKNGQWGTTFTLLGGGAFRFHTVVNSTIVAKNADVLKDATALELFRAVDKFALGAMADFPVKLIKTYDGYDFQYTSFVYDETTATYDPSGMVAQYNEVTVIPGSSDGISKPVGYTKNYFFNGL
ncbi:hypothetical protein L0244_34680, partial [bacterium]|nr:hypothetical protein [bacterium]